ncbi:non-structural protein 1 [Rotavirus A]|uniref:Non-structural protein 1 n=1 Tax=Rotavirus A TaxID=28875 RepID=A0A0B6VHX5_9REOV|nr:non-structural protein 1 [Rotavirus A]
MATFKDACFHYKKLNKLNSVVLKIGANSSWRPSTLTKLKGWCLQCCQHTDLTYCNGCSLYHVCQWCAQDKHCFLDAAPHFLRMRTFRETEWEQITTEKLQGIVDLYKKLFPINGKIVEKFESSVKQNKCRNEYDPQWYNHLTLPITLQALSIKIEHETYHIFGFYDNMHLQNDTPFYFTNHLDKYDKLLLDSDNFDRMEHLPVDLLNLYALKYLKKSRFLSAPPKEIVSIHFTTENYDDNSVPTSPINVWRNCIPNYIETSIKEWNLMCKKIHDANFLLSYKSMYIEHYSVSQKCKCLLIPKLQRFEKLVKPQYACSNHEKCASKVKRCNWCSLMPSTFWEDFRMREIYDLIMELLRILVKSNTSIGHCSSHEFICEYIPRLFNPLDVENFEWAFNYIFDDLNPTNINGEWYLNIDVSISNKLYEVMKICGDPVPRILSRHTLKYIIKHVFNRWFNLDDIRMTPLTLFSTESLNVFQSFDKLIDEYALLLSDSEDE